MNNIVTCPKCGWNYDWPMHTTMTPNCPRCFPMNRTLVASTTATTVKNNPTTTKLGDINVTNKRDWEGRLSHAIARAFHHWGDGAGRYDFEESFSIVKQIEDAAVQRTIDKASEKILVLQRWEKEGHRIVYYMDIKKALQELKEKV